MYVPTGTQGIQQRRKLFTDELFYLSQTVQPKPILLGDWNRLSTKEDLEDFRELSTASLSQKISIHLNQLVKEGYFDGFLHNNSSRIGFTWRRRGKRSSRLDRVYLPSERSSDLIAPAEHHSHLSDHDALIFSMKSNLFIPKAKFPSNYWKLNKSIL